MPAPRKIALFGGTFDPVHLGHIQLATLAQDALGLDQVRFLPCQISPHKTGSTPASGTDRCAMLHLATTGIPWAIVDDFELQQPGPSYSYQTAEAMTGRFPEARLFWIMGFDQWDALPRWANPQRLAALVEFIVLARGEMPQPRTGCRMHVIQDGHPAAATAIREAISSGETTHPWLDPKVAAWIAAKALYRP